MNQRILILTDASDRHYYFCNRLIEALGGVVGVITNGKEINRSWAEELRRALLRHPLQSLKKQYFQRRYRAAGRALKTEKRQSERHYFSGAGDAFYSNHSELHLGEVGPEDRSINDRRFVELVKGVHPDIIVVMGTCILGRRILECTPVALNMHTGLSPYYRGGRTNFWPFVENDPGYFGVTVHKLSRGIDSGDIIFSQRVVVEAGDTFGSVNCKSIVIGTGLMIEAIEAVDRGTCRAVTQWTHGKLFHDRHWNFKAAKTYLQQRDTVIARQMAGEANGEYAGIATVRNGRLTDD